jgi:hypothetical protein
MARHVLYHLKAEESIYRMIYHTYRLYRFLGYKSNLKLFLRKKLVFQWLNWYVRVVINILPPSSQFKIDSVRIPKGQYLRIIKRDVIFRNVRF